MSQARTTELLQHQSPGYGCTLVPWDGSETPCQSFHCNAAGTIDVEFLDGSTGSLAVVAGVPYGYHVNKFLATGDTPVTYYFAVS